MIIAAVIARMTLILRPEVIFGDAVSGVLSWQPRAEKPLPHAVQRLSPFGLSIPGAHGFRALVQLPTKRYINAGVPVRLCYDHLHHDRA
jgi:hypothetical protein